MTLRWPLFVLVYSFFILFSGSSAKSGGRGSSHSRSSSHSSHSSHSFHSSSTHYYGGYTVGHYRGGGHSSSHRSTHPTVSEKDVVDAIFTHSNQTFFTAVDNGTFHYNDTDIMSDSNSTTERLSLYASKPANPMWATADLAYYWGLEYLPNTESECISNVSEVESKSCNETIDTCLRSVSDIRLLATIDFFTRSNGSRLSQLTWHCPSNKRCCDWECCEEAILSTFESFVILIFVLAGICYLIRKAAER